LVVLRRLWACFLRTWQSSVVCEGLFPWRRQYLLLPLESDFPCLE
jgi:hypothetical protein